MEIKKVVITGDAFFLDRHQDLFKAMSQHVEHLEYLPYGKLDLTRPAEVLLIFLYKMVRQLSVKDADRLLGKNSRIFMMKSHQTERKIRQLGYRPDLVFHIFSMYSPLIDKFDIPYVMYLDYTMALAVKNWSTWAPFKNEQHNWLICERQAYQRAYHLFAMTNQVKKSLIEDYGIEDTKITVVGSAGNFSEVYQGNKNFGSKQILFNGSDFHRKGGDIVIAAFKKVKQKIPDAKLVVIGKKITVHEDGIDNPGQIISGLEMRDLFLQTDLVVAPASCEPFGLFIVEAMNCGVPCIVSANSGVAEFMKNEVNGIIIERPTSDSLAESMINMLGNPQLLTSISRQARELVTTRLNWDNIAKKIVQVLSGVE